LPNLFKFLINYGFYKFGLEISLLLFIAVIFIRHELFAMFYLILFVVLVFCSRVNARKLWKFVVLCITVSLFLQCLLIMTFVAIKSCQNTFNNVKKELLKILKYLFHNLQMLYEDPSMIIADFILLTTIVRQVRKLFYYKNFDNFNFFKSFQFLNRKKLVTKQNLSKAVEAINQF
jgi:energy-coupling factor transporter transmembrane protein EcfT